MNLFPLEKIEPTLSIYTTAIFCRFEKWKNHSLLTLTISPADTQHNSSIKSSINNTNILNFYFIKSLKISTWCLSHRKIIQSRKWGQERKKGLILLFQKIINSEISVDMIANKSG